MGWGRNGHYPRYCDYFFYAAINYVIEKQSLKISEIKTFVTVIRRGKILKIDTQDIMVGDIIQVIPNSYISVDSLLVKGNWVMTDESAMSGEAGLLRKEPFEICQMLMNENNKSKEDRSSFDIPSPVLLSGTEIKAGEGWYMAISVG